MVPPILTLAKVTDLVRLGPQPRPTANAMAKIISGTSQVLEPPVAVVKMLQLPRMTNTLLWHLLNGTNHFN